MDILEKIKNSKIEEVREKKALYPVSLLQKSPYFQSDCVSFSTYIKRPDKSGVIAEFKRKSPSEGFINQYASVEEISIGYMQSGASGLSVLTDEVYFGGSSKDLSIAREFNYCPILRKDFIVDEYQIIEARSIGADVILLIAEILTKEQIATLSRTAQNMGLEVLMELHSEEHIEKISDNVNVVGVNNRNLKNFSVDIKYSLDIFDKIPKDKVKISESGIKNASDMLTLYEKGYDGFLIGTQFMKSDNPVKACRSLIEEFEELKLSLAEVK
ncbi:indole-3-glycerol phosphate synthase TrpC [Membranihabitans maritimus]|uniref:indole-3-glycerol phosphate synthase TrpC n=1 Tax=Membranihabitans maritimus TaxID=2904244 RepID=UPI001F0248DD|nr:indole-3-glycerol phosphate synthase TrpC [Membranihabitans maritimus]